MNMDYAVVPHWFLGYNIFLELLFFIVTLMVGVYALRIYQLSGQGQSKLFGISFLFISAAYLIQSILNFASSYSMAEGCNMQSMKSMHALGSLGIYTHIILFIAGLVTLAYMALKIKSIGAYLLFLVISLGVILVSSNPLYLFYTLSSILLIYTSFYYLRNYLQSRRVNSLIVLIAFLFLLFGKIHFIFSINHGAYYVAGHFLELVAYSLIFINLLTIIKRK
ncbi:hypothetical protein HYY70_04550 [Candidatus Woesearchaeota archaeon]|nr:hypothetical protein [Candidatus Woesearchaeota archaeon]